MNRNNQSIRFFVVLCFGSKENGTVKYMGNGQFCVSIALKIYIGGWAVLPDNIDCYRCALWGKENVQQHHLQLLLAHSVCWHWKLLSALWEVYWGGHVWTPRWPGTGWHGGPSGWGLPEGHYTAHRSGHQSLEEGQSGAWVKDLAFKLKDHRLTWDVNVIWA